MADNTDISQASSEVGADASSALVSQAASEVGADASSAQVSQAVSEVGASASSAQISQLEVEIGANKASVIISQLTIELGRGPEIAPPEESPVGTFTVGAGLGNSWFIALQLSDSGEELRDKVVKSFRLTGKTSGCRAKLYRFGPLEDINIENIENGTGQAATLFLPDTNHVQQSKRFQVNLPNAMTHTVRVEGNWNGEGEPDQIHEMVMEAARCGVRR